MAKQTKGKDMPTEPAVGTPVESLRERKRRETRAAIERSAITLVDELGYENVTVCCTIENQQSADRKLPVFCSLPVRHRCITAQPLLERVNLEPYLDGVELVVVGG